MNFFISNAYAQVGDQAPGFEGLIFPVVVLALFYFFYIRPNSERQKGRMMTKPKQTTRSIIIAIVIYLIMGSVIATMGAGAAVAVFLLYLIMAMFLSYTLLMTDISNLEKESNTFKRIFPFDKYGDNIYDFQYSFKADNDNIIKSVSNSISNNLNKYLIFSDVKLAKITDIDKSLKDIDNREFIISESKKSLRGGKVSQLIKTDNVGKMYSIKWWLLISGTIDKATLVSFVAFAPLTIPFWITSRLMGDQDLAVNIRDIYPAHYEFHKHKGVKTQRGQVSN